MIVDISMWKPFRVGDLFDCETTLSVPSKNNLVDGDVSYITRSAVDNGLSGHCGNLDSVNVGRCITIGAEGFVAFWQPDDFVAGNKVYALRHSGLNELRALFVCAALNVLSSEYSFSNARILDSIKQEVILLPATPDGEPDWAYMEAYMQQVFDREAVFAEHLASLMAEAVADGYVVDTSAWKAFRVGELFDVLLAKGDIQPNLVGDGNVPLVSAGTTDNGIVATISDKGDGISEVFSAGCLTVSMFGTAFWQNEPFYAVSHGRVNVLMPKRRVSDTVGLFLASAVNACFNGEYDYSTMCTRKRLLDATVTLPATPDGAPDWAYMERYMRDVMAVEALFADELDRLSRE